MPILFAVPSTIDIAASIEAAVKSGIFVSAILLNCSFVIVPTTSLLVVPAPLVILAAFFNKAEVGGVFSFIE